MIYIIKQAGLYQNKVNSSLISNCNCKMGYSTVSVILRHLNFNDVTEVELDLRCNGNDGGSRGKTNNNSSSI